MKEYTLKEAAEILGVAKSTLHTMQQRGTINAQKKKVGNMEVYFVKESELKQCVLEKKHRLEERLSKMDKDFLK